MSNTQIEWTDVTDNIIVVESGGWWCRRISAGCDNCYAAALNQNSFYGGNKLDYSGYPPELILKENVIRSWAQQRKSKRHFVSSMTDIFGEWVNYEWHSEILSAMMAASKQTFQLLTKRPDIMAKSCNRWMEDKSLDRMPDNIWLGTTVENRLVAQGRISALNEIPAQIRFLSCEPLLEGLGMLDLSGISWVITGGESGKNARYCELDWIRSLVDQCQQQNIAVFVKQMGSFVTNRGEKYFVRGKGTSISEFPLELRIQQFP